MTGRPRTMDRDKIAVLRAEGLHFGEIAEQQQEVVHAVDRARLGFRLQPLRGAREKVGREAGRDQKDACGQTVQIDQRGGGRRHVVNREDDAGASQVPALLAKGRARGEIGEAQRVRACRNLAFPRAVAGDQLF